MLAFAEEKRSTKPFRQLVTGFQDFLQLCTPESRVPVAVNIETPRWRTPHPKASGPMHYECSIRADIAPTAPEMFTGRKPFAALEPAAMQAKLAEAVAKSEDPDFDAVARWSPIIPPPETGAAPSIPLTSFIDYLPPGATGSTRALNFVTIGQFKANPDPHTVWLIINLCTPFDAPDAAFLAFWKEANKRLPFKLQESKWRKVEMTKKGTLKSGKFEWPK